jgi:outer membrane protein assembly factor BamE (lipoprotein component of BamABCDE complex)
MKKIIGMSMFVLTTLIGCTTTSQPLTQKNSALTQGNVQMNLEMGKTTKSEVLEKFGAPNITTRDGAGNEVWSYQRSAQVTHSANVNSYWTIIFGGQSSSGSSSESSSSMITLIIKFNAKDVVIDFNSRTSNF